MRPRKLPMTVLAAAVAATALICRGPAAVQVQAKDVEDSPLPSRTPYPEDFKLEDALNFYSVESTSLLKRSMLSAGFSVEDTVEVSESYLDFASRALAAEKRRIEGIRDAIRDRRQCSAEDGECTNEEEAAASEKKTKDDKLSPGFGHFLTPDLEPGQAELLRWDHDGSVVQDYAARVGLPPQLVPTLKEYAKGMGMYDIMENMLYDDPLPPNGVRWFSFQSPYQKELGVPEDELRNFTWNVERPAKNWKSDMHWFNTADELSHEDALRALARGGFDEVLKGIGEKFGLDSLHVDSVGFVSVTNCDRGFIHTDWEDVDGRAFNFLLGISNPEQGGPELIVENDMKGETYYGSNAGILVGDGTRHGTRECDHRGYRGVRITASIYLADATRGNLDVLAGDTTSVFPPTGDGPGKEWIWTQRGRHWRRDSGNGLVGDLGRTPFEVEDYEDGCTEEDCTNETERGRNGCLKTCRVFMDDSEYKPGKERREVLGY